MFCGSLTIKMSPRWAAGAANIPSCLIQWQCPARGTHMGNTLSTDMGNTFSALVRPGMRFEDVAELLNTSSQTPSFVPLGACDEVFSSS